MTDRQELMIVKEIDAPTMFVENGLDPLLKKIKAAVEGIVPVLTTAKGRKEIASRARWISRSKVVIDKTGKEYVAALKEQIKPVDAERKRARTVLDKLRDEVRQPLTDWEEEETRKAEIEATRIEEIKEKIKNISEFEISGSTVSQIKKSIKALSEFDLAESIFQEFTSKAEEAHDAKMKELKNALMIAEERKAIEDERKRLEKEKELIAQKERDRKIKEKAAEDARLKAERDSQEAADKLREEKIKAELEVERLEQEKKEKAWQAERELEEAEETARREKQEAVEAEKRRAEEEQQRKEEAKKIREADTEHRRVINRKIISLLVECDLSEKKAISVLTKIIKEGKALLTINY